MSVDDHNMEIQKQPIEMLPDEMLMEIFKAMDAETLKESAVVHPKWNDLIGQNSSTMKQLRLVFNVSSLQKAGWLRIRQITENFTRKYYSLKIEEATSINQETARAVSKHVELRQLEFHDCGLMIKNNKILAHILQTLRKLEVLKFIDTDMDVYDINELKKIKVVQLPNLKTVVLHESTSAVLALLRSCEITTLKINGTGSMCIEDYITEFLATQKKIEALALRDMDFNYATVDDKFINDINFPLKKLALNMQTNFLGAEKNALQFLEKFGNTLEELELGSTFPASVYEMIFKQFNKLKVLDVNLTHAPKEDNFYINLRPNVSVKKLIIRGLKTENEEKLQGFMGNLPNVESLILIDSSLSKEMILFMSNNSVKLQEINMESLHVSSFKDVVLPNIKSLRINSLTTINKKDWYAICRSLPNIQKFSVKNVFDMSSLSDLMFLIFTKGWKNLTHIDLGTGFEPKRRMFTLLLRNSKNIKTVTIPSVIQDKNKRLADLIHQLFEKVQGPRLIFKSLEQQQQEYVGLWDDEDCQECFDDEEDDDDDDSDIDDLDDLFGWNGDSSDNEFIFFDSDGEMRYWNEGDYLSDNDVGFF